MNILLTSAGRRAYMVDYFKQCSGINNVYASNSQYTIALKRADGYLLTPLIYDEAYIKFYEYFNTEFSICTLFRL